jgi:hypothetical protein
MARRWSHCGSPSTASVARVGDGPDRLSGLAAISDPDPFGLTEESWRDHTGGQRVERRHESHCAVLEAHGVAWRD